MNRYMSIMFSVSFVLVTLPCQVSAASITEKSAAIGEGCIASGENSTAMGYNTIATGRASTAMGEETEAINNCSTAMGYYTKASGSCSTAMGDMTTASGTASIAMGELTTANGRGSIAMGFRTRADGECSFAGGKYMQLRNIAEHTFIWGYSDSEQSICSANAFLIFPAGTPGKVGIGTPDPYHLVDLGWTLGRKLAVYQGPDGNSFYGLGISDYTLEIYAGADVQDGPAMVVKKPFGLVGIGTANPSYKLHVMGNAAGISWTNLSSRAYKEDIQMVDKAAYPMMLSKLINMELATYKYKKEYGGDGVTKLGFIAEEMPQEVLSKDGKGVDLYELLALTIGAVKAHQKETDELKAENDALRQEIRQIKAALGM